MATTGVMVARLTTALLFAFAADVVPHCGGPKKDIQGPGQDCGAHGPHWLGVCRAPLSCFDPPSSSRPRLCTIECKDDAACASLGPGFTCSLTARPYANESASPVRVCATK